MATPKRMGTQHITTHMSDRRWEPQRTNNFELQITGLSKNDGDIITLSVDTFSAPTVTVNPIVVPYGNNKTKFAGTPEYGECSVSFNDFIGQDTERVLDKWFKSTYDVETEVIGNSYEYKRTAYLIEYSPDGLISRQWSLFGCWLSGYQLGEFAQEGGSVRKVTGTLQYDYFKKG